MPPSPIEIIYEKIFGSLPKKSGTALERLAAIAMFLLEEGNVTHDSRIRGQFSKTLYQIDAKHSSAATGVSTMGEAKDYSGKAQKVGRGDVQKLAGALPDLDGIDGGAFFSATGYTAPAKKYAEAAESITGGKPIALYELSASTEIDERGFIKTIIINLHLEIPEPHRAKFIPIVTAGGQEALKRAFLKDGESRFQFQMGLSGFCDANGQETVSLGELTSKGYGSVHKDDSKAHACYWLPGQFIDVNGVKAAVHGLQYEVPHRFETHEIRISDDSKHRLALRDKDGKALAILTDEKIRTFAFDDEGHLINNPNVAGGTQAR